MLLLTVMALSIQSGDGAWLKERGLEVLQQIRREYYLPESKLYCDSIVVPKSDSKFQRSGPAFNWGTGVMLSALNAAARLEPKYKEWLREYADASRVYWNDKGPVPGYDVLPGPKPVDRYYDDNAWMVLALVETYEILEDPKYLDWAEQALAYVLSGEDEKLGGGIYWRESDKKSKNTCSNAPAAVACLAVARHRRGVELSAKAIELLQWVRQKLQDPKDGLFWDSIDLNGKIDPTQWSYNTALYLHASALVNIDEADRERMLRHSIARWSDPKTGAVKDTGRFAHLWLESLLAQSGFPSTIDLISPPVSKGLRYLWANCRNPDGRFGDMWNEPYDPKREKFELIDQASVARGLLFAARAMKDTARLHAPSFRPIGDSGTPKAED